MIARHVQKGFSLLELLIVLAVMVGLAAIAWPSLRRPLADSTTLQAAREVAEFLADGRAQALSKGQPVFVYFEAGGSQLVWGDWQTIVGLQVGGDGLQMGSDIGLSQDGAGSDSSVNRAQIDGISRSDGLQHSDSPFDSPFLRSLQLPDEVVVERVVRSNLESYLDSILPLDTDLNDTTSDRSSLGSYLEDANWQDPFEQSGGAAETEDPSPWYLPISATGFATTTVVILYDAAVGSRAALELDGQTGMMRVERLAPSEPGLLLDGTDDISRTGFGFSDAGSGGIP